MNVDQLHRKYELYRHLVFWPLENMGISPAIPLDSKEQTVVYRILPLFSFTVLITFTLGVANYSYANFTNFTSLMKNISYMLTAVTAAMKVAMIYTNREKLCEMHRMLNLTFEEILCTSVEHRAAALSLLGNFYRLCRILMYSLFSTVAIYFMTPWLLVLVQMVKHVSPRKYILPFPVKYPWSVDGFGPVYLAYYFLEFGTNYYVALAAAVDALFGFYIFQMAGIFRASSLDLENVRSQDCQNVLALCVDRHAMIIRCRKVLEDIYGPLIFWSCSTSAVIMCSQTFRTYQSAKTVRNIVGYVIYMAAKLIQAFTYSWHGSFLTSEGEMFQEAVYYSRWWEMGNMPFNTSIVIILVQKPLLITALHFFYISMDLFVGIIHTAMSYFFLLKTLDEAD